MLPAVIKPKLGNIYPVTKLLFCIVNTSVENKERYFPTVNELRKFPADFDAPAKLLQSNFKIKHCINGMSVTYMCRGFYKMAVS